MEKRKWLRRLATTAMLANILAPTVVSADQSLSGDSTGEVPFSVIVGSDDDVNEPNPDETDTGSGEETDVPDDSQNPSDGSGESGGDGSGGDGSGGDGSGGSGGEVETDPTESGDTGSDPQEPIESDGGSETDPSVEPPLDEDENSGGDVVEPIDENEAEPGEPENPVAPEYVITIPSTIDTLPEISKPKPDVQPNPDSNSVDFEIKARDVMLPEHQAVQVDVQATEDYRVDDQNVLLNGEGDSLGYAFEREADLNYGFEPDFSDGNDRGLWTVAHFRSQEDELYTDIAPMSINVDDDDVPAGTYDSVLQFNINVVDTRTAEGHEGGSIDDVVETGDIEDDTIEDAAPEDVIDYSEYDARATNASFFSIWENGDGTASIVSYDKVNDPSTSVVVPREINGFTITRIESEAFINPGTDLKSVEIPGTVKSIGDRAFYNSAPDINRPDKYVETIILHEGLESIGHSAFHGHMASSIVIPDSVLRVGSHAFDQTTNIVKPPLETVVIGENTQFVNADGSQSINVFSQFRSGWTRSQIKSYQFNGMNTDMDNVAGAIAVVPTAKPMFKVLSGSTAETYAMRRDFRYEYIGEATDFSQEDAAFKALVPSSRNFPQDGAIEVGEDVFNEYTVKTNSIFAEKLLTLDAYGDLNNPLSSIGKEATATTSRDSLGYIPVEPGQVFRFDFPATKPDGYNGFGLYSTDQRSLTDTTYGVIDGITWTYLTSNRYIYEVPEGATHLVINLRDPSFRTLGEQVYSRYHMIRIK